MGLLSGDVEAALRRGTFLSSRRVEALCRFFQLLVIANVAIFGAGCRIKAPAPVIPPAPPPAVSPSEINVSVSLPTSLAQNALNSSVPTESGADPYNININGGADNCGSGVSFGYHASRGPINLAPSGNTISATTELDYWAKGRARYPCIFGAGPLIYGSCGVGESLPGFALTLRATFGGVDSNWNPQIGTALTDLHSVRDCKVTLVGINVTGNIQSGLSNVINGALPTINQAISNALNLKTRAQQAWAYLLNPIKLQDSFWLSVHPRAIGVFPLSGDANSLNFGLRLTAQPELAFTSNPPASDSVPLPAPSAVPASNSFSIELPIEAPYTDISEAIDKELLLSTNGIRYPPTGSNYLTITGASFYGYGNQAVLRIDGNISGIFGKKVTVYLVGTPSYNSGGNVLSFPDMDFSIDSHNLLLKLAAWLEQDKVRDDLRTRVVFDLSKYVTEAKGKLQASLNQTIGAATVTGAVNQLNLLDVYSSPNDGQFKVLFLTNGTVNFALH
jgi:hypothetical protein